MNLAFEEKIHKDLCSYLLLKNEIDVHFPQAIDIEYKWGDIAVAYIPDGVREYRQYPIASLAWMMYLGMAITQYWDEDWEKYGKMENLYLFLRDKEGYDTMDEYIRRDVLHLKGKAFTAMEELVQACAERVHSMLMHEDIEPATEEAFDAYVSCLHQLYLMGMAVQLHRLGYKMLKMGNLQS